MSPLIILGAGDLAREIYATAHEGHPVYSKPYKPVAFVDEDPQKVGTTLHEIPIVAWSEIERICTPQSQFICGVGTPVVREAMEQRLKAERSGARFANVVHKSAVLMPQVELGKGIFVAANATIAIGAKLGDHSVVNQNASVGHDCELGNYTVVSPGVVLSGRTSAGDGTFIGSGAITYPGAKIGRGCVISAQAVVARRLKDFHKAIAKPNVMVIKPSE